MATPMNITMIGTGYVGLVSGTCFAEMGMNVTCVDIDAEKIRLLKEEAQIPIYEPGLKELVAQNVAAGKLDFTTNLADSVPTADAVFIAVGTPQDEDGSADMKYVLAAAEQIAAHLQGYTVIVNKSTVPVGTAKRVEEVIASANPQADFDVVSNPEFLREGDAIKDFMETDRVVVGVPNARSQALMEQLYTPQTSQGVALLVTDPASSELIKYAANAFLATKITFINEIAQLCQKVGANVQDVSKGMGLDTRIGARFLQPGPGYGGSCFPKDTHALAKIGQDNGQPMTLVEQTIAANQHIKEAMASQVISAMGGVAGKTIAVWGLAFKANTDDMRDGPALTILPLLHAAGAKVVAYDPEAMENAKRLMPQLEYAASAEAAVAGADALVLLTEWEVFTQADLTQLKEALAVPQVIDLRNVYSPSKMAEMGFAYTSIGRTAVTSSITKVAAA